MFFEYTEEELAQVFISYFEQEKPLKLKMMPAKEKKKYLALIYIVRLFEIEINYSEKEVNEILIDVYYDYVSLRRYLVDYQFLKRTTDGRKYWVNVNEGS